MSEGAFALTGLISRGGLSNWVFFFFPDELVMVDVGMTPALKAGVQAGMGGYVDTYGPMANAAQGLHAWSAELQAKAKNVVEMKSDQIRTIHFRMRMMAHELWLTGADGDMRKFGVMNRKHAESMVEPLRERFGSRFDVSKTPVFGFIERHAPFLL